MDLIFCFFFKSWQLTVMQKIEFFKWTFLTSVGFWNEFITSNDICLISKFKFEKKKLKFELQKLRKLRKNFWHRSKIDPLNIQSIRNGTKKSLTKIELFTFLRNQLMRERNSHRSTYQKQGNDKNLLILNCFVPII